MSNENVFAPNSAISQNAFISSMEQYKELYKQSLESPELFWGNIAKQFHWEEPADSANFLTYNFDLNNGPIFTKWMENSKTNICYNLLDRNVRNGHADTIAFYWYVIYYPFCIPLYEKSKTYMNLIYNCYIEKDIIFSL